MTIGFWVLDFDLGCDDDGCEEPLKAPLDFDGLEIGILSFPDEELDRLELEPELG